MRKVFLMCVILISIANCSYADVTPPTVSWLLETVNGQKHYQYTLTNTAIGYDGNPVDIWAFELFMSLNGELSIESHSEPSGWTYISRGISYIHWGAESNWLHPGQTAVFSIYTSINVPTNYSCEGRESNWYWSFPGGGGSFGNSNVAIPGEIPEPSSLLALIGGIAGIGGIAWRRRR